MANTRPNPPGSRQVTWELMRDYEVYKMNISLGGRNKPRLEQLPRVLRNLSPRTQFLCCVGLDDVRIRDPVDRMIGRAYEHMRSVELGDDFRNTPSRTSSEDDELHQPMESGWDLGNPAVDAGVPDENVATDEERYDSRVQRLIRGSDGQLRNSYDFLQSDLVGEQNNSPGF
jgi:hypothetical protein